MPERLGLNPWLYIWTQPRKTIRSILEHQPRYGLFWIGAIWTIAQFFYLCSYLNVVVSSPFYLLGLIILVLSPFLGGLWIYFYSALLYLAGKWLKGPAAFYHVRAAYTWSLVPLSIKVAMWIIFFAFGQEDLFIQSQVGVSWVFIHLILLISGIWSLLILIFSMQEVQRFSFWRSCANVAISYGLFLIISLVLAFIYRLLFF